ncbi:MAG: hypothetical protein U0M02_09490 [Acutalibacteraceae bacterium]|nr:hypothetical protein [Acutalibacteraceae bacterium]
MTDLETIARAKMYIDKLANGINPLDDTAIEENDVVNNVKISRCLFFVSDTLQKVIENGGITIQKIKKAEFNITAEELEKFDYSDDPISISEITKRINDITDTENSKKLSYISITSWLIEIGMLVETKNAEGKKKKHPTSEGAEVGIFVEEREGQNGPYHVVVYNKSAQKFIVDNFLTLIELHKTKTIKKNQGSPWTLEQEEQLVEMYKQNISINEIAAVFGRSKGGIRARLQKLGYYA